MAKRWFAERSITVESEGVNVKTNTMSDFKLNTKRILTTDDLVGVPSSLGPFGNAPNASGATIAANVLTLQPASTLFPGGVTTGAQSFAGVKSFTNGVQLTGASTSNGLPIIAGTNVNEMLFIQNIGSMNFTTVPTLITFDAPLTPASVDGITLVAPSTIRITKKGSYMFRIQTNMDGISTVLTIIQRDGVNFDGSTWEGREVGVDINISQTATFYYNQTADEQHDITWLMSADSVPVGTPRTGVIDLTIHHINLP